MGIVYIKGLRAEAVIGVYEWERHIRQTLLIDLEMASDTQRAAANDDITDALDYAAISRQVLDLTERSAFQLVESLAHAIAELIVREFGVPWLRVRISKPGAVRDVEDVGVIVETGERP